MSKVLLAFILTSLFCFQLSFAALNFSEIPSNCSGQYNTYDLIKTQPQFENKVPNGIKYTIDYDGRILTLLNLTGNAYDMGYAHGQLMQNEIQSILDLNLDFLAEYLNDNYLKFVYKLPQFLQTVVQKVEIALVRLLVDIEYMATVSYTPQRFIDEMNGIADGSGISVWDIRGLNMFAELIQASCSILGVWGNASDTKQLYQMRTLDFTYKKRMPLAQYPAIITYHSTEPGSAPFSNIAWAGFVGTVTGYGAYTGVGEKFWPGNSQTKKTRLGEPWNFALRDVLQFSRSIDDALDRLNKTKKTCSMYFGVGAKLNNTFRVIEESANQFNAYTDKDWHFDSGSPQMDGVIYVAENSAYCFRNILQSNYGNINPAIIQQMASLDETGNQIMAIYDYKNNYIYVSYPLWKEDLPAYSRPAVFIDLNPFFMLNVTATEN